MTHPRLFSPPLTSDEACSAMEQVLESPSLTVLYPGERFPGLLADAMREIDAVGNLAFDAQIVALCRERGVSRLLTEDGDFSRFTKLKIERL